MSSLPSRTSPRPLARLTLPGPFTNPFVPTFIFFIAITLGEYALNGFTMSAWALFASIAGAWAVAGIFVAPQLGALTFLAIFVVAAFVEVLQSGSLILMAVASAGLVRCTQSVPWSAANALVLIIAGTIKPPGDPQPFQIEAFLVWAGMIWFSFYVGSSFVIGDRRREELEQGSRDDLASREAVMAQILRGSVAEKLREVTTKSSELELLALNDEKLATNVGTITKSSKDSQRLVKELLQRLSDDNELPVSDTPSIEATVNRLADGLRSHGFNVVEHRGVVAENAASAETRAVFDQIACEGMTNVVKYGDNSEPVTVHLDQDDDQLHMVLSETPRSDPRRGMVFSSGRGLSNMAKLAEKIGGRTRTLMDGDTWALEVRLPIKPFSVTKETKE